MELGVCYYPEHWPEETWEPDGERMKVLGLTWARIGEFAWSRLEPNPGELDFGWLDEVLDILGEAGLKVVLGTPTATPPKWLCDKYDDIYPVDAAGRVRGFGSRRHYCFNSASYLRETERIVTLLAERYGHHQAVGAWQTDNEYGCHDTVRCYCENCREAFRTWLERKYGSIEALNAAWWNVFWSMEYRDFGEIELPNSSLTEANPSHLLDYYRFASDSVIAYNRLQVEIIRPRSPRPITHNAMGYFGDYDHFKLARDLDILTWDSYPLGTLEESPLPEEVKTRFLRAGHPDLIGFMHDLYYGAKGKPFWVMEQQPGQVNWASSNPLPAPGAVRLWSQQAFAHGAEVVSYFRWRPAPGAQELMHAGLNLHGGTPDRASAEVKRVAEELAHIEGNTDKRGNIALLFDYENLWATNIQRHAQGWDYWGLQLAYYTTLRGFGLDVDLIHPSFELTPYKLVFAPALHLVDEALARQLEAYVAQGGRLVIGPRSGFKWPSGTVHAPAPGPLADLMGVRINHVDALPPYARAEVELAGNTFSYHTWADLLTPTTAEVLARYQTDAYANEAAVTRNTFGEGICTTLGMWGSRELHQALFASTLEETGIELLELPEGLRVSRRGQLRYLLNFNPYAVTVPSPQRSEREVKVAAYDVSVSEDNII
jgi:beta-galactosidase